MSHQSRFDARYWMVGAGALGRPRGRVWGGRREEGSGWETHVYLWRIHFDIWQNQYNSVKFKKKKKSLILLEYVGKRSLKTGIELSAIVQVMGKLVVILLTNGKKQAK